MKDNNSIRKESKHFTIYTILTFLFISIVFLIISSVIHFNENTVYKEEILKNETNLVNIEKNVVTNKVSNLVGDLLYISDSLEITSNNNSDYTEAENLWLSFSKRKKIYDQIRFIDLDGNEVIRINYADNNPYIVSKDELQNKSDRYYFTQTMSLERYQVYISQIDLNIENGVVEEPLKPMVRISAPYYNSNDELKGIVVLNYYASDLLNQIEQNATTSFGNISVINTNGYWVFNNDYEAKEWGFMYEHRQEDNFINDYPEEWKTISENFAGGTTTTTNGVFNYTSILTDEDISVKDCEYTLVLEDNALYIVSHINSDDTAVDQVFYIDTLDIIWIAIRDHVSVYVFLLMISGIFGTLMTYNKIEKDKIKYFSEYDTMTNTYNRRAGFKLLKELASNVTNSNKILSICFIDINSLKAVNDNLGHDKGDELILSVVSGIKENIRESDYIIRLGGDEFLIVFDNLDEQAAETIWKRIKNNYDEINKKNERQYLISASHGIETHFINSDKSLDDTINSADVKMYNEKRIMKSNLKIVKNSK